MDLVRTELTRKGYKQNDAGIWLLGNKPAHTGSLLTKITREDPNALRRLGNYLYTQGWQRKSASWHTDWLPPKNETDIRNNPLSTFTWRFTAAARLHYIFETYYLPDQRPTLTKKQKAEARQIWGQTRTYEHYYARLIKKLD